MKAFLYFAKAKYFLAKAYFKFAKAKFYFAKAYGWVAGCKENCSFPVTHNSLFWMELDDRWQECMRKTGNCRECRVYLFFQKVGVSNRRTVNSSRRPMSI